MDAFEKFGYRNTLLVAMHGGSRVGVENHWSEAVIGYAALVEIERVGTVRNDYRRHDQEQFVHPGISLHAARDADL